MDEIYPINKDYRLRRHSFNLSYGDGTLTLWDLQHFTTREGKKVWRFVRQDRSPVRLGLYCADREILPDAENAELLASLAQPQAI